MISECLKTVKVLLASIYHYVTDPQVHQLCCQVVSPLQPLLVSPLYEETKQPLSHMWMHHPARAALHGQLLWAADITNANTRGLGAGKPTWDRFRGLKYINCLSNTVRQVKSVRLSYRQEMCEPIGFNRSFDCLCFTVWEDVRAEAKWTTSQAPVFPDRTESKSLEPIALIAVATGGVYLERCHTGIVFETHSSHAWLFVLTG